VCTFCLIYGIAEVSRNTNEIHMWRKSYIVDLDYARKQFLDETNFAFMEGCRKGTNYGTPPPVPQNQFNQNSPIIYCNKAFERLAPYFEQKLGELGKRRQYY
jgi:hypothetical protein